MLGQAQYIKEVFGGILDERCRIFLIKKCLPLLPTLGRYKNATELLLQMRKEGCDWYKEFLKDLETASTSKPPNIEYVYPDVDMSNYYRFAAFVASHIQKQKFDAKWEDGTFRTKIKDEKEKQPLGGEPIAGEKAMQDWFIGILDGVLVDTFGTPGSFKTDTTWCAYAAANPNSEIFDMDFYYGCGPCKKLPKEKTDPILLNPCCKYKDPLGAHVDSSGEINCDKHKEGAPPINADLQTKLDWIKCAVQGVGSWTDALIKFLAGLSKEERCYICRKKTYMINTELWGDDIKTSIWDEIEDDLSFDDWDAAEAYLNCKEFTAPMKDDLCEKPLVGKPGEPGKCTGGNCTGGPKHGQMCNTDGDCDLYANGLPCQTNSQCKSGICKTPKTLPDPNKDPADPGGIAVCVPITDSAAYKPPCVDGAEAHYETYTRILDLMLYETVKSYLL